MPLLKTMNKTKPFISLLHLTSRQVNKSVQFRTVISHCGLIPKQPHVIRSNKCLSLLYFSTTQKSHTHETAEIEEKTFTERIESNTDPKPHESPDVQFITNGDPTLEKKLKILFLELEVFRQEGKRVPSSLNNDQWKEMLNTSTRSARKKYLTYLWGVEMKKQNDKRKKDEKRLEKEERYASDIIEDDGQIHYGLNRNTIHMRIYDTTINQHFNNKLVQAIQFGQKIIVDCGYDSHMTSREALNAAKQITILFSENRNHQDPFNLYLCNANRRGNTLTQLQRFINTLYEDHFPVNVTEKSYLDLFSKDNLVYLTPHCRDELTTFDHDAIYIIGAMVDKINTEPLSLGKAKKEGLRMAKLPLERYLNWGSGSGKSLTLNQMMLIMLEMKTSGDWEKALVHVPRRKLNFNQQPGSQYQARYRPYSQFQDKDDQPRRDYQARDDQMKTRAEYQYSGQARRRQFQNRDGEDDFVKKNK